MQRNHTIRLIGIALIVVIVSLVSSAVLARETTFEMEPIPTVVHHPTEDSNISPFNDYQHEMYSMALQCSDDDGNGEADVCWCSGNELECVTDLKATCHEGDLLSVGPDATACFYGEGEDESEEE